MNMMMPFMQQKTETRKGGPFEDVQRPWAQTLSLALMHFARVIAVLVAAWSWAKVWESWEPTTGRLSDLLTLAMYVVSLIAAGVAFVRIDDHFDADLKSRGLIAALCLISCVAFNYAVTPVVVFALVKIQSDLVYALPVVMTVAAWSVFAHFKTGQYSFIQELTRQTPTNSEGYWIEELKQDFEREKRDANVELTEALDKIEVLQRELTAAQQRQPDKVFVPFNHGGARAIGDSQLSADEVTALSKYITGWRVRGTGREPWTSKDGRAKHGGDGITDPQWRKFTALLKSLSILDSDNRPNVGRDQALKMLKLPPYPTDNNSGGAQNTAQPDPTRPHPTGAGG